MVRKSYTRYFLFLICFKNGLRRLLEIFSYFAFTISTSVRKSRKPAFVVDKLANVYSNAPSGRNLTYH